MRVEKRVEHGVELEGPREGVVRHQQDAEHRVHHGEHDDQGVESIPHLFPERKDEQNRTIEPRNSRSLCFSGSCCRTDN